MRAAGLRAARLHPHRTCCRHTRRRCHTRCTLRGPRGPPAEILRNRTVAHAQTLAPTLTLTRTRTRTRTRSLTITSRLSHEKASARESSTAAGESADGAATEGEGGISSGEGATTAGEGGISSGEAGAATPCLLAWLPAGDSDSPLRLPCRDRPRPGERPLRPGERPLRPGERPLRLPCLDCPGERPVRLLCLASACVTRHEAVLGLGLRLRLRLRLWLGLGLGPGLGVGLGLAPA